MGSKPGLEWLFSTPQAQLATPRTIEEDHMVKLQIGLATATRSALIAMLFASLGCVREPTLDVAKWKAVHDTTLTP